MLAPHLVVPTMKGDTMIVDNSSSINGPLEISIPLVAVQLELQCFHASITSQ